MWSVDQDGVEGDRLTGPELRGRRRDLLDRLRAIRGDLEPAPIRRGVRIDSGEAFHQLKALGYLGEQ